MDNKEYKYDAFISYRHCELDKFVAENLHRILETYELPKSIKEKLGITSRTFKRVFRDQEELPLSSNLEDPIIEALKSSKYLIVICSPRLKDSLWCKKEIQTFKKLRGRKNIFCVLIEGEPVDSFPEEVLFDEEEVIKDGKKVKERIPVEPLAADVRGKNNREVLKKIKEEKLRLIAPMFNLDYDDLRQRNKIRKQKRIITISVAVAIFCLLFAIYSTAMFIKINVQQNILAKHQALSLASQSSSYLDIDDRYDAIKLAYQALTDFEYVDMPYTAEAEYALSEGLGVYDSGQTYKAISEIHTNGVASYIKNSDDNSYAAVYDESEELTLFNTKTMQKIKTYKVKVYNERSFRFIGNDILAFITENGDINLVNASNGDLIKEINKNNQSYYAISSSPNNELLAYTDTLNLYLYNIKENKLINSIENKEKYTKEIYFSHDSSRVFAFTEKNTLNVDKEDYTTMYVYNTNDLKEENTTVFNAGYIVGYVSKNNNIYLLMNRMIKDKYNMLIVSYDYINGKTNWSKTSDNDWGKKITESLADNTNSLVISHGDVINVLNMNDGSVKESFNLQSEVIDIYSYYNSEMYLAFTKTGVVSYINMEDKTSLTIPGRYDFKLDSYSSTTQSKDGFLLVPYNENRVILYEQKVNSDMKEEQLNSELPKDETVSVLDQDNVIEEYHIMNKSLISRMLYDTNKEVLFVNYTNNDIAIYSVKDKKLLNTLSKVGKINHYFGKDKYNRIYIGDISNSYILNDKYELVGHIQSLHKLDNDKVIISDSGKYYSIKIYTLNDLINEAKKYLGE